MRKFFSAACQVFVVALLVLFDRELARRPLELDLQDYDDLP